MSRLSILWVAVLSGVAGLGGCADAIAFPAASAAHNGLPGGVGRAYDTDGDGVNDFFLLAGPGGHVDRIAYAQGKSGRPDEVIRLDDLPVAQSAHLVLILDGFGLQVVEEYYAEGNLRVFHPPSRVIAPYPTLSDPALQDLLDGPRPRALEAVWFDRSRDALRGGSSDYLSGANQPYNRLLDYRAGTFTDAIGYIAPWRTFLSETSTCMSKFQQSMEEHPTGEFLAYFVSSAGVSTADGASGQRRCLERVERMVLQVLHRYRGKVKITMMADHGHSYTPPQRLDFESLLKQKGWHVGNSLKDKKSVVPTPFGLVTVANFTTNAPAELAADLVAIEGVELVSYLDGDAVIVLGKGGAKAHVRRGNGGFRYDGVSGDPLRLRRLLETGRTYSPAEMLASTATHTYPIPLERLWRAHHGLVQHPPDVIASLTDNRYYGAGFFGVKVGSTHGSLNRVNSTTFVMSTAGPLPPVLRSAGVHTALARLLGRPWPQKPWPPEKNE